LQRGIDLEGILGRRCNRLLERVQEHGVDVSAEEHVQEHGVEWVGNHPSCRTDARLSARLDSSRPRSRQTKILSSHDCNLETRIQ